MSLNELIRNEAQALIREFLGEIAPKPCLKPHVNDGFTQAVGDLLAHEIDAGDIRAYFVTRINAYKTDKIPTDVLIKDTMLQMRTWADEQVRSTEYDWQLLDPGNQRILEIARHLSSIRWLERQTHYEAESGFHLELGTFLASGELEAIDFILDCYQLDLQDRILP